MESKVLMRIIKYISITLFALLLIAFITLLKPITIYFIENYASNLLEQKVKVTSLNLFDLRAEAFIQNSKNKIKAQIITISPLVIEASFSGDIDAFSKYHSLKGEVKADAIISYDEKFIVDVKGTIYDANAVVEVKELNDGWFVQVDAKALNIEEFKKQNSFDFEFDGVVDFKLTNENEEFDLSGSLTNQKLDALSFLAKGRFEEQGITSSLFLALKDKKLSLEKITLNTKATQLSISTKEFGGDIEIAFKDEKLTLDAKELHIKKVLEFIDYKDIASGVVSIKGDFNTKNKKSNLVLTSPKLAGFTQELKDIKLNISSLDFKDSQLKFNYILDASFMKKAFSFDGNLSYKDKLHITASSSDFKSKSSFELNNKEIKLSIQKLDIKEFLEFASLKPYASGLLDLNAKGNFDRLIFDASSDATVNGIDIKVDADGFFITKTKELNSKFNLFTTLGHEKIKAIGDASYKKDFRLNATSEAFKARTNLKLRDESIEFYTKDLDLQRVAKALDKPNLPFGKIDFLANGSTKNITLNLRSKELRRDMSIANIDDFIAFDLSGTYKNDTLTIKDKISLHQKSKILPLMIDATISLVAPYNSSGSLTHKNDKIVVDSFSFENEQVKTKFEVDIKELYSYKIAFARPIYGALKIRASYSDSLHIESNSFGGELHMKLSKSYLLIDLKRLEARKLANLFDKNSSVESGFIDGVTNYEIKKKRANTKIVLRDANISGIDIDRTLNGIDDLLGLNFINISKSFFSHYNAKKELQTNISQLQLDLSLKDKNIKLDDIALRTDEYLIVAQGDFKDNGDINRLDISVVDKNGCAIATQAIEGTIANPSIAKTSSTLFNIVKSVPKSILKTANKMVNVGTGTIDGILSYGWQKVFRSDSNISISTDAVSASRYVENFGYDMIMPSGCEVIYNGKVLHPANLKKDEK